MLPVWPDTLPAPERDNYRLQPVDPLVRTPMESGKDRTERMFGTAPTRVPLRWTMTDAEFQAFKAFHRFALDDGAREFSFPLFLDGGFSHRKARFAEQYSVAHAGFDTWRISAELTIYGPLASDDDADLVSPSISEILRYEHTAGNELIVGHAPANHTPIRVDIYIQQAFNVVGSISLGWADIADPNNLVVSAPVTGIDVARITITQGHTWAGAALGVQEAAAKQINARFIGTNPTQGRALIVVTYEDA